MYDEGVTPAFRSLAFAISAVALSHCGIAFEADESSATSGAPGGGPTTGSAGGPATGPATGGAGTGVATGTGGLGGSGGRGPGAGGSAGVGGGSSVLVDTGLLARYWIDEASEGTDPPSLQDAAPNPQPLTITYADGLVFATNDGNRALLFPSPDQGGLAEVAIDGTKLAAIDGVSAATLEAVIHLTAATSNGDRIIHFGAGTSRFSLEATSTTQLKLDFNHVDGLGIGTWDVADLSVMGRVVVHAVLDTTVDPPSDRVRLHLDGVIQTGTITPPTKDDVIVLTSGQSLVLGNRLPAARSMGGYLHYAAVYLAPLTSAEIAQNVAVLTASDDAP